MRVTASSDEKKSVQSKQRLTVSSQPWSIDSLWVEMLLHRDAYLVLWLLVDFYSCIGRNFKQRPPIFKSARGWATNKQRFVNFRVSNEIIGCLESGSGRPIVVLRLWTMLRWSWTFADIPPSVFHPSCC